VNRRALLICYYFPPLGLGGVGRPLNLFKLLPTHGYDCDVLTVKPVLYRAYEPELLDGLDTSRIFRSGSHDIQRILYLAGLRRIGRRAIESGSRATRKSFPDSKKGWVSPAVRLGRKLLRENRYDVIISTSPPVSSHLVARQLASESKIPWVADFRDFWHSFRAEEVLSDPASIRKAKDLLTDIRAKAAAVTAVSQSIANYVGADEVITNGFSSEAAMNWRSPSAEAPFTIGLLGTFNDDLPIDPLLRLLSLLREQESEKLGSVRIVQVGNVDRSWLDAELDRYRLRDNCSVHGFQKRDATIRILNDTSVLYVGLNHRHEVSILPGRLFDMLASGRPILAHVPRGGEVAHLIAETRNGFCFVDQTTDQALAYLSDLIAKRACGDLKITPVPDYSLPYSWGNVVGRYAQLLDRVL
jgi:glycosyltransferase involved in cell wall biosynthesis